MLIPTGAAPGAERASNSGAKSAKPSPIARPSVTRMSRFEGYGVASMKLRQLVLVVEPSDKLAQVIRAGLRTKGFEVTTAKRGSDAIRAATALSSDVIVANTGLPDMTGADLRRAIQQHDEVADLPLVLFEPRAASRARYR